MKTLLIHAVPMALILGFAPVSLGQETPAKTKKPPAQAGLRVLLFAEYPTREFQFVRALLLGQFPKSTILDQSGTLAATDPLDLKFAAKGGRKKTAAIRFDKGKEYRIQLTSEEFDPCLRLLGPTGVVIDEDFGNGRHVRIDHKAVIDGEHQIVVTAANGKLGEFRLTIHGPDEEGPVARTSIFLQSVVAQQKQVWGSEDLLAKFPSLDAGAGGPSLSDFDVIIAFDPDWMVLPAERLRELQQWVGVHGGGLIVVAGNLHSYRLHPFGPAKLRPIRAMLPVRLRDAGLDGEIVNDWCEPFPLRILEPESEILILDDLHKSARDTWTHFFWGPPDPMEAKPVAPINGFFWAHPLEGIEPRAVYIASLATPRMEVPFLLTMAHGVGRVVYVGSGELWRLRHGRDSYHARLWLNLILHASPQLPKVSRLDVPGRATAGDLAFLEARLLDAQGNPYKDKVFVKITPADGKDGAVTIPMFPRRHAKGWFGTYRGLAAFTRPGDYEVTLVAPGLGAAPAKFLSRRIVVSESAPTAVARADGPDALARQQELTVRYDGLATHAFHLAQKLDRSQDVDLVKQARLLRQIQAAIRANAIRSRQLGAALKTTTSLEVLKNAELQSQLLCDGCAKLRSEIVFPGPLPARDQPLGGVLTRFLAEMAAIEALINTTHAELDQVYLQVAHLERLAKSGRLGADQIDDLRNSLSVCRTLLQSCGSRNGKAQADMKALQFRPEAVHLFTALACHPLEGQLPLSLDQTLDEIHKDGKTDMKAMGGLKTDIQRSLSRLETVADFRVGKILAGLIEIEADQVLQKQQLQSQRNRLEDDLLRELLGK